MRNSVIQFLAILHFADLAHTFSCRKRAQSRFYKSQQKFASPKNLADNKDATTQDEVAYPEQTPHSGRHFLPSHPAYKRPSIRRLYWKRRKRFMEGWYYRLTLEEENISFAFIISIEDPGLSPPSELRLACIQVVGPEDSYLVQADKDDSRFWARKNQQALGCTFEFESDQIQQDMELRTVMTQQEWEKNVKSGFQIMPSHFLGRVDGHDGTRGGVLPGQGVPGFCGFDFSVVPLSGWGSQMAKKQKSTGGWLSYYNIFEPHWQVTMAGK
jgi:tocopherol cyclase